MNKPKRRNLLWFQIDYGKCNVCRLCEEVCPTKVKSIHHTNEFEVVFDGREDFVVRWGPTQKDTVTGGARAMEWYTCTLEFRKEMMKNKGQKE